MLGNERKTEVVMDGLKKLIGAYLLVFPQSDLQATSLR